MDETTKTEGAPLTPSTPEASDPPPSAVSLDVMTAMHDRLLKLLGRLDAVEPKIAALEAESGKVGTLVEDFIRTHGEATAELLASVTNHADLLDGLGKTLEEISSRVAKMPAIRAQPARTLPPAETVTELQIDPQQLGTHVQTLPDGQVVEVNVRRPAGGGAVIRDGRPVAAGGKVRRS